MPHLIGAGEDLGFYLYNNTTVYEGAGRPLIVRWDAPQYLMYLTTDCTGPAFTHFNGTIFGAPNASSGALGSDGTIYSVQPSLTSILRKSIRTENGDCNVGVEQTSAMRADPTADRVRVYNQADLRIELR